MQVAKRSIWFVIPCCNEESVLDGTVEALLAKLEQLSDEDLCSFEHSGLLLVDDGSTDETWSVIESWANRSLRVSGLRLSRNNGHQSALIAGLTAAVESCRLSAYVSSCSA